MAPNEYDPHVLIDILLFTIMHGQQILQLQTQKKLWSMTALGENFTVDKPDWKYMTTNWGWKIIHHDKPEKKHQFFSQVALVWIKG